MRYQEPATLRTSGVPLQPVAANLDASILAMTGILGWWDYDPANVVAGTDIQLTNKVSGGSASVEVTGAKSTLVLSTSKLPVGGQIRRCGQYLGTTVVQMGGSFPSAANSVWTKVIIFRIDETEARSSNVMTLWKGPSGGSNNHHVYTFGNIVYHEVGTTGSLVRINSERHANGAWNWVVAGYDNGGATAASAMQVNGEAIVTADRVAQQSLQANSYFGGDATTATLVGRLGPAILFGSTTVASGSLFHSSRTADLAAINAYCAAVTGRLNILG